MTDRKRDPLADFIVTRRPHRWFVWRDVVTILLAVAVVMLVRQVGSLRDRLDSSSATRTRQLAALTSQFNDLQSRLGVAQEQSALKDSRIKQLTDALIKAGIPVPPGTVVVIPIAPASPAPSRSPHPTPTPTSGPRPTPGARPTPTPTRTRTPSPTPSPTCTRLPVVGICRPARK